jgi:hypothetical protein
MEWTSDLYTWSMTWIYTMSYPKRFKVSSENASEWPRIKTKSVEHNSFLDKILMTVWVERKRLEHEERHKKIRNFPHCHHQPWQVWRYKSNGHFDIITWLLWPECSPTPTPSICQQKRHWRTFSISTYFGYFTLSCPLKRKTLFFGNFNLFCSMASQTN